MNTSAQHNRKNLPAHVVNSVYGKRSLKNYLANAKNEQRIIYNKNEEQSQVMPQVQYERDINDNSSKDSISQTSKKSQEKMSDRDSLGNTLTEAQQSYFAESKVRDENGNLKVMYHGSPNADFTIFKSGTYFTEHKWYADVYQNQGASSLSYKKTANKPDTYAVYLNIKKPFDTRNKTERDIFYNEYYQQWGIE